MNKIFKASFILTLIIIISKICGFGRELVVSYFFGATNITDSFYIANLVPNFFYLIVVQAISVAFIPVVMTIEKEEGKNSVSSFTTRLILYLSIFCIVLALLLSVFSRQLISLFAPGFAAETADLGASMLQIAAWFLLLQAPVSVLAAFAQSKKKFIVPSIFGLITDFSYILFVLISAKTGTYSILGFIPILAIVLEFAFILPVALKNNYSPRLKEKSKKYLKLFLIISIPTIFTVGVTQLNTFVGKMIASKIAEGVISSYNYAWNVCNLYEQIFISAVCVVLFSELAELMIEKQKNEKSITDLYNNAFRIIAYLVIPLSVFTSIFSKDLVRLIYGRGEFDERAIELTSKCLMIIAITSPFYVLNNLGLRFLYADKKTLISTIFAVSSFGVGVGINFLLFYCTDIGIAGLAISTAAINVINCLLTYFYIIKYEKIQLSKSLLKTILWFLLIILLSIAIYLFKEKVLSSYHGNILTIILGFVFVGICVSLLPLFEHGIYKKMICEFKKVKKS